MLQFNNVSFSYPNKQHEVLSNINFAVENGEWLTILGNNGSGKSTLMKLISGQYKVSKGNIVYNGLEYNEENFEKIISDIAIVFQNPDNQFIGSTVEEDIAFGLENRQISSEKMKEIIDNVLNVVDMQDYRFSEPKELSGGQKQRVAIASALALKPKLLILDEATSMLDPVARENIVNYIKKINKYKNITIISITHDVEELKYSDNILLINEGKIVLKCDALSLFNNKRLLEKYHLEVPFLEKIKYDLNKLQRDNIFISSDSEEDVLNKLCKLILKM